MNKRSLISRILSVFVTLIAIVILLFGVFLKNAYILFLAGCLFGLAFLEEKTNYIAVRVCSILFGGILPAIIIFIIVMMIV